MLRLRKYEEEEMITAKDIRRILLVSGWFMILTLPILGMRVDPLSDNILWRLKNVMWVGLGTVVLQSLPHLWHLYLYLQAGMIRLWHHLMGTPPHKIVEKTAHRDSLINRVITNPRQRAILCAVVLTLTIIYPQVVNEYQINIMIMAFLYIMLGLGLNIVVGMAGLLDLGFVAFYAVGAYTYALLNLHYGINFWMALPLGGIFAGIFGLLLGFPILRLRGDYLAIVTLGFGEIIRVVLENWIELTHGVAGIVNIPGPTFFGLGLTPSQKILYLYYLMVLFVVITIFVVNRLQDSRLGRAWLALREDEIACQAMGIDKRRTKLAAFSLGAFWAGIAGVVFAAQNRSVYPVSFSFLESAMILSIVVLGGMGSIVGVILGALILILLPEYLRELSQYRMLFFGAILVLMMIFRPQGLISVVRRKYDIDSIKAEEKEGGA